MEYSGNYENCYGRRNVPSEMSHKTKIIHFGILKKFPCPPSVRFDLPFADLPPARLKKSWRRTAGQHLGGPLQRRRGREPVRFLATCINCEISGQHEPKLQKSSTWLRHGIILEQVDQSRPGPYIHKLQLSEVLFIWGQSPWEPTVQTRRLSSLAACRPLSSTSPGADLCVLSNKIRDSQ